MPEEKKETRQEEIKKVYQRRYRENNANKIKEYQRRYREKQKEFYFRQLFPN